MRRAFSTLAVTAVAATGVVAGGCGGDDKSADKPSATNGTPARTANASTGAATLRASLTALLEDHVYLTGITVAQAVRNGLDSAGYKAAAATLDDNSVALADVIGSVYGSSAGQRFLTLWRKHIGFFVDYANGRLGDDTAAMTAAQRDLDAYRQTFGVFLSSANPNLPTAAVAAELEPHITSMTAAIDSAVIKSPGFYERLRIAAGHMPMTAKVLAAGIAKQFPSKFSGSTDAGASELRAGLTALLEDHAYLASLAVDVGVRNGFGTDAFKKAATALDANTVALGEGISSVYGEDAGNQFLALWRKHVAFFVTYAKAKVAKSTSGAEAALADLDGFRQDFGAFVATMNPNLPKDTVAGELERYIASLSAAIRADVLGSPKTFGLIREAASGMPHTAEVLAGGIAKQFSEKFPSN